MVSTGHGASMISCLGECDEGGPFGTIWPAGFIGMSRAEEDALMPLFGD